METNKSSITKTAGVLVLAALLPVSAWAFGGPWGGGRMGPPQEALDACAGKKAGDAVTFTTPRGDNVSTVCRETPAGLAAVPGGGPRGGGMGMGPGRHFDRMARTLDLTAEQQTQIRSIFDAEREKTAALRQQLAQDRQKMRTLAETTPYDEAAVRTLAASQEKTRVELVVSRTRAMNRAYALLTPAQREKARQCGPFGGGRPGRGPGM
jgi:Spy/CpxP family protein refolding chaperone